MIGFLFAFCIIVLSQAATLIRFANAHPLAISFWRLLIAVALLLPLVVRYKLWRQFKSLDRNGRLHLYASGLMLFVHFYFFFRSVQETSVANVMILFSLNPLFTAVGAWLMFREKVRSHLALALAIGFAGVFVLFFETAMLNRPGGWQGDLWGVLSALCFSAYILTGKQLRRALNNVGFAAHIYAQTAVYSLVASLALDVPLWGYEPSTWIAFAALAVFPTLLGHALFTYCLNYLNVTFMSCMTLTEPLLAAVAAYYLFSEPFTPVAGIAFTLTCASVLTLYWPTIRLWLKRDVAGEATP